MEINISPSNGHTDGVIIRDFRAARLTAEIRARGNLQRLFSVERLARTYLRRDPGPTGFNTSMRTQGAWRKRERKYTVVRRIWYSRREEGITSWEDSRYPRDLVNRRVGPRNFKPRADTFDSRAISSARSELADSTIWHTSYFTYVIFFMRSAREALSKIVISYSRVLYSVLQFRANRLR